MPTQHTLSILFTPTCKPPSCLEGVDHRRENFEGLRLTDIKANKIELPTTLTKYVLVEYYGPNVCNIVPVTNIQAAEAFINASNTECTHRTLVDLDGPQVWTPLMSVRQWCAGNPSRVRSGIGRCPTCDSDDPSVRGRVAGAALDFSCRDYWCENDWHEHRQ